MRWDIRWPCGPVGEDCFRATLRHTSQASKRRITRNRKRGRVELGLISPGPIRPGGSVLELPAALPPNMRDEAPAVFIELMRVVLRVEAEGESGGGGGAGAFAFPGAVFFPRRARRMSGPSAKRRKISGPMSCPVMLKRPLTRTNSTPPEKWPMGAVPGDQDCGCLPGRGQELAFCPSGSAKYCRIAS